MKNYRFFLGFLLITTVNAVCISGSAIFSGIEEGDPFSNRAELEQMDIVSLKAFITCTNENGDFSGAQFIVQDSSNRETKLSPLGDLTGTCQQLALRGPIEQIQASYNGSVINAIKYFRSGTSKSYGNLGSDFKTWTFNDTSLLIGLQGRVDGKVIKQIGFLVLDPSVQSCTVDVTANDQATNDTAQNIADLIADQNSTVDVDSSNSTLQDTFVQATVFAENSYQKVKRESTSTLFLSLAGGLSLLIAIEVVCVVRQCSGGKKVSHGVSSDDLEGQESSDELEERPVIYENQGPREKQVGKL